MNLLKILLLMKNLQMISNIYAKSGVAIYFKDLNNDYELKD